MLSSSNARSERSRTGGPTRISCASPCAGQPLRLHDAISAHHAGTHYPGSKTNGYRTLTIPPPLGLGNFQRFVALTMQRTTLASATVEVPTAASRTFPVAKIVKSIMTLPFRSGSLRSP